MSKNECFSEDHAHNENCWVLPFCYLLPDMAVVFMNEHPDRTNMIL